MKKKDYNLYKDIFIYNFRIIDIENLKLKNVDNVRNGDKDE